MALKPCGECGESVSTKAVACPRCGAPIKPQRKGIVRLFGYAVVGATALVLIVAITNPSGDLPSSTSTNPQPKTPRFDNSTAKDKARLKVISDLQSRGGLGKVDCRGQVGDMWVTPLFQSLPFEDKERFAGIVYAYCFDGTESVALVNMVDNQTGKKLGTYSLDLGLRLR